MTGKSFQLLMAVGTKPSSSASYTDWALVSELWTTKIRHNRAAEQAQKNSLVPDWIVCRICWDLSYVQIACTAVFVSLNNSSTISFCCFMKTSPLEPSLKFKVRGREIGRTRQAFQSGPCAGDKINKAIWTFPMRNWFR